MRSRWWAFTRCGMHRTRTLSKFVSATPPDELDVGGFTQEEPGFLAFDRPLLTPAGQVELPKPTPAPIRLAGLAYEPVD
jgi:hypothetical protein